MSDSSALPSLFTQLQVRYPTSGLLTELVQMDADRCVVRALVQLGSMTLATSMATAATVEQAEDQARLRVLALLGIHTTLAYVPAVSLAGYSTPTQPATTAFQETTPFQEPMQADRVDSAPLDSPPLAVSLPDVETIARPNAFAAATFEPTITMQTPLATVAPYRADATIATRAPEDFETASDRVSYETTDDEPYDDTAYDHAPDDAPDDAPEDEEPYQREPFEAPMPVVVEEALSDDRSSEEYLPLAEEPATKSQPRKSGAEKPPVAGSDTAGSASRDLSSLISQIGVEIERIGWSKRQGSTYLQKTYGKKTRSELTDDELEDFLTYLNTQPAATVSS
ncbi:MAG: hypothetical protein RBJ76_07265 [Stenomitos frigidus ULC029]